MRVRLFRGDTQKLGLRRAWVEPAGASFLVRGCVNDCTVRLGTQKGTWSCTCHDHQKVLRGGGNCKHIFFVKLRVLGNAGIVKVWEDAKDGSDDEDEVEEEDEAAAAASAASAAAGDGDGEAKKAVPRRRIGTTLTRAVLSLHADMETGRKVFRAVQRHEEEFARRGLVRGDPKRLLPVLPRSTDSGAPRPEYASWGLPFAKQASDDVGYDSEEISIKQAGKRKRGE
jgi:hypothetical protein